MVASGRSTCVPVTSLSVARGLRRSTLAEPRREGAILPETNPTLGDGDSSEDGSRSRRRCAPNGAEQCSKYIDAKYRSQRRGWGRAQSGRRTFLVRGSRSRARRGSTHGGSRFRAEKAMKRLSAPRRPASARQPLLDMDEQGVDVQVSNRRRRGRCSAASFRDSGLLAACCRAPQRLECRVLLEGSGEDQVGGDHPH